MDPDRGLAVDVERDRQIAETLTQAADMLLVSQRLIDKIGRHDREHDERQQALGEIHQRQINGDKAASDKKLREAKYIWRV
jgi:type VI protein secretion system component VasF